MNFYNKYILPKLLNSRMNNKDFEKVRAGVVEPASGIVLEMGFGSGLNLPFYKNISKLYALEPSFEMYNLAKNRINNASFSVEHINASAEKIPLPANSVDTIVSTWSLCSIPNPTLALKEMLRVLKHEGKFLFKEHGASPKRLINKLQRLLTPFNKRFAGNCHLDRQIEKLINEAGFKITRIENAEEEHRPLFYSYKGIATKQ